MKNKEQILRDLEFISGGFSTFKALCKSKETPINTIYYDLFDGWHDTLFEIMDLIEEEEENAQDT